MAAIKGEMPPLHAAEALAAGAGAGGGGGNAGGGVCIDDATASTTINLSVTQQNQGASTGGISHTTNSTATTSGGNGGGSNVINNTISAAADSSDQPGTPQPPSATAAQLNAANGHLIATNEQQQHQAALAGGGNLTHHPYATHHMYGASTSTPSTSNSGATTPLPHLYAGGIYASAGQDMQQQQQQVGGYPTYLNSYENFYQQQAQSQMAEYGGSGNGNNGATPNVLMYGSNGGGAAVSAGVRYHPYLQAPTSGLPSSSASGNSVDPQDSSNNVNNGTKSSGSVSTTTSMSPRVVSSTSPTSTSTHLQMSGNPGSPGCKLQCKKCGIMCTNESELQEHITNVHGASPYGGSSGYSSSPYIKEELQSGNGSQQGPATQTQQAVGGNPGDILDLDSQKMVYPPLPSAIHGGILQHPHQQHHDNDPLHSMHNMMQQRALPGWDQTLGGVGIGGSMQEGLPSYMHQQGQEIIGGKANANSSYYSSKQSPYHGAVAVGVVKHEYPLIKSEYAADSQNYGDKSFDPTDGGVDMCQQAVGAQPPMMPVSSSPAEFPSTTTGSQQEQQQQYRGFEPPTSSSVLPANSVTAKAATWKSNEARRPKTYNCTACNKWFTSSGHLKRHYNTTLHKNAVKSSGQPDPATLPISAHHHPARDPSGKHSRRNNAAAAAAAAAAQQQPPVPSQPPEPPEALGPMSHYSASPSPTQAANGNGISAYSVAASAQQQQQQHNSYSTQSQYGLTTQVQSTTNASPQHASNNSIAGVSPSHQHAATQSTVLNGHPNGLAGPSAPTTTTTILSSSHTRGLLNTTTIITKSEPMEDTNTNNNITTRSPMVTHMDTMSPKEMDHQLQLDEEVAAAEQLHQQELQHLVQEEDLSSAEEEEEKVVGVVEREQEAQAAAAQQLQQATELPFRQLGEELVEQHHYRSSTPSSTHSMRVRSPLIISHQQYQEQLQQQMVTVDSIFSHTPPLEPQPVHMPLLQLQQQPVNTMDMPAYSSIIPLGMQPQQPLDTTTINTSMATTNMDNIRMLHHNHHHHPQHMLLGHQPQPLQQQQQTLPPMQHSTLLSSTSIQSTLGTHTISRTITTPPPQQQPQQHITNTIPSFQQLQQQASALAPLEHTMTYHTIIGNGAAGANNPNPTTELLQLATLDAYGNFQPTQTQMLQTADGQILQFIPANASQMMGQPLFTLPTRGAIAETYAPMSPYLAQRSPQEADLPPAHTLTHAGLKLTGGGMLRHMQESTQSLTVLPSMPYSPTISSSTTLTAIEEYGAHSNNTLMKQDLLDMQNAHLNGATTPSPIHVADSTPAVADATSATAVAKKAAQRIFSEKSLKRKRTNASSATTNANGVTSPIRCLECDKEFSKICYLTQHNKSFHSGEYPFRCQKCGKRFQCEDVYTTHLGRHKSLDKPHKCDICPKQFHHKTDLRRHVEAIHTGLKQHTCDVCQKSFCRKDHLRKHLETHNRPRVIGKKTARCRVTAPNGKTISVFPKDALPEKAYDSLQQQQQSAMINILRSESLSTGSKSDTSAVLMLRQTLDLPDEEDDDAVVDDESLLQDEDESVQMPLIKEEFVMIEQDVAMY